MKHRNSENVVLNIFMTHHVKIDCFFCFHLVNVLENVDSGGDLDEDNVNTAVNFFFIFCPSLFFENKQTNERRNISNNVLINANDSEFSLQLSTFLGWNGNAKMGSKNVVLKCCLEFFCCNKLIFNSIADI